MMTNQMTILTIQENQKLIKCQSFNSHKSNISKENFLRRSTQLKSKKNKQAILSSHLWHHRKRDVLMQKGENKVFAITTSWVMEGK